MIEAIKKYNTRIYLSYDRCIELYELLGEDKFIDMINNSVVITFDQKSSDFLKNISKEFKINE